MLTRPVSVVQQQIFRQSLRGNKGLRHHRPSRYIALVVSCATLWQCGRLACAADGKSAAPAPRAAIDGYADYATFAKEVEALASPGIAEVSSLGTTLGGRKLFLISVGTGKTAEKPALLIVGNVSAPHLLGSELAVRMARRLIADGKTDADVKSILELYTFYFIPRPSPDASEAFFQPPLREREGNLRKPPDDWESELDPKERSRFEDLNRDGWITSLRVADPTGRYRAAPDDPRVMIERDPLKNEQGGWELYPEGRHVDDDPAPAREDGVAFNHNFPFHYPYFKPGAGPHAVSEIETRAVADFAFDHPNIAAVFSFTPEDNLMHTWKPGEDRGRVRSHVQGDDVPEYEFIAEKYRKLLGAADAPQSPSGEGSFAEWAYYQFGRWSFGARGWWIPTVPPAAGSPAAEKPAEPAGDGKQAADKPSEPKQPLEIPRSSNSEIRSSLAIKLHRSLAINRRAAAIAAAEMFKSRLPTSRAEPTW